MEKMKLHKLEKIYIDKLLQDECVNPRDLLQFSNIRLNTKRKRKKFNKYFYRYITKKVYDIYIGCIASYPLSKSFKQIINFPKLERINEEEGMPKVE
jgi:hypothetical protein